MGKRLEVKAGDKYGHLTIIKEVEPYVSPSGNKKRKFLCSCDCGSKQVEVLLTHLREGLTTSCGCVQKEKIKENGKNNHKTNIYDLTSEEYGIGYTSKGEEFYFDLDDFDKIKDYSWHIDKYGYVATSINRKIIKMHRLIMNTKEGVEIDHIFHKTNDNRKSKLREVTHSQNNMNRGIRSDNTSGVTGVYFDKVNNKWWAEIGVNGKKINLGRYINKQDAINARKEAENRYFGEYKCKENVKKKQRLDKQ